jgi:hypothetical protein
MISMGCDFGGPGLSQGEFGQMLLAASRLVEVHRGVYTEGSIPEVNVVYYVPGSITDFPPLDAPRAGRFSRKQKLLLVEVYVPKEQVASGGSVEFIIDALRQACVIASEVFEKKKAGPFDLAKANAIIDRVRDAMLAKQA